MRKGIAGLMFVACTLVACQNDVYDPNYNSNLGARVPDNFEWSTTKTLNVNVEVKDEYNGKYYYAVRVYDKAPGDGVLPVAASSKVNKDLPFSQKIVIPATVSKLYIVQAFKNANGSEVITKNELAVTGENITYSFGNSSNTRSASTRADEGVVVKAGEVYKIDAEDAPEQITVEDKGELQFTTGGELFKCVIRIKDGGKMTAPQGSELLLKNSDIYNYGEVNVYDIEFTNGSILYNGDAMEGENEGGCFYANNITLVNGSGGDKRYLGERSYTSCKQLILDNVKLTLKTSAWLKCDVLNTLKDNGDGASTLLGEGDQIQNSQYIALAMIGETKGHLTIEDNVLVECNKTTGTITGKVVSDATGLIKISGTTCNEGGFGNDETYELGKYTYIIEDMYPEEGDYDMNDIVVSMTATQKGNELTIIGELKAIGASYAITPYIKVNNETQPLFTKNGQALEAHETLNVPTSTIINTIKGSTHYPAQPFTLKFSNVQEALSMDNIDFYIIANSNEVHWNTISENPKATWGMRIPGLNFKWAQEKMRITKAYLEFSKWFDDSSYPWYNGKTNPDMIYNAN